MNPPQISPGQLQQLAQAKFNYDHLHPGQVAGILSLLEGRDTLVVMPTGSGKSAIYQLAALLLPGPTVVVSPLIALQQDQVETLATEDLGGASQVNSTMSNGDREAALADLQAGALEFIFLAPEQFNRSEVLAQLQAARPSLFVVDEAHCISEWGHDFRPDYLRLGTVIEALDHPTVLALTATAAPPVREEILNHLHLHDSEVIVQGFDRPNIWLGVRRFEQEREKQQALVERVCKSKKPGIVYVATRKRAEEMAEALRDRGVSALAYHAGMKAKAREQTQTAFMSDEVAVMVATTAFGMGIDKPNVRFVFHYNIPDSLDRYYQELGRAGRDGAPAQALLFYQADDLKLHHFFASSGQVDVDQVEQVTEVIQAQAEPIAPKDLKTETQLSQAKLTTALSHLQAVGAVETLATGEVVSVEADLQVDAIAEAAVATQEQRQQFERSRLAMIRGYAENHQCRREYLLNYFGEILGVPCGFCDNCQQGEVEVVEPEDYPFPLNGRVNHAAWGEGMVIRYEGDKMVILFDQVGYKTLAVDLVQTQKLLTPVE